MRLKEIKPGMVIHCKNDEEKKALLEEAERLGYCWLSSEKLPTEKVYVGNTIHFYAESEFSDFKHITWSDKTEGVTEFSDLILPELTAEEALLAYDKMCRENYCCNNCPIHAILGHECVHEMDGHISEILDAIAQWKSDHEKKDPEIETVDICRIIEVLPDGRKRCLHEEEINPELPFDTDKEVAEILKRYCMEHDGEFIAVHEVVSRVKK